MFNKVLFQLTSKTGKTVFFRYPTMRDARILTDYINKLSIEKTFIPHQGEKQSLIAEKKYLKARLQKAKKNTGIYLLAFVDHKLAGYSEIGLMDRTEFHVGELGITVDKDFRGEGIGDMLLDNILKESQKLKDLKIVMLQVYSPNTLAQNLYKKFGFVEYGCLPDGVFYKNNFVDSILMYKKVK